MRRRPAFSLMIEDGHLVEVKDAPIAAERPANTPEPTPEPTESAADGASSQEETKGFPCPYCDYVAKKQRGRSSHIGREHKDMLPPKRRKR